MSIGIVNYIGHNPGGLNIFPLMIGAYNIKRSLWIKEP